MHKTATDQSFAGRRVKLGMVAIGCTEGLAESGPVDGGIVLPVQCNGFTADDKPRWFSNEWQKRWALEFVPAEADLRPGTWTWPERV